MTYEIHLSNQARKFLKRLDDTTTKRISDKLESLKKNPVIHDSKSLGRDKAFRVRVGKYRIKYAIHEKEKVILVYMIDKRSRVYK